MIKKAAMMLGLRGGGAALIFLGNVLMARLTTTTEFGGYAFIASMVSLLTVFVCMGCDTYLKRESATIREPSGYSSVPQLLYGCIKLQFFLLPIGISLLTLSIALTDLPLQFSVIATATLWLIATVQIKNFSSLLIGLSKPLTETITNQLGRPLLAILILSVLSIYTATGIIDANIFHLVSTQTIALTLTVFMSGTLVILSLRKLSALHKSSHCAGLKNDENTIPSSSSVVDLARLCLPFALLSSVSIVERNTDTIMLTALNSLDSTALYYAATRISAIFLMALFVLNAIATPTIVKSYKTGNTTMLENTARRIARYTTSLSILLFITVLIFGERILLFFGNPYVEAHLALIILSGGNLLRNLLGPVILVASMTGHETFASRISMTSLALNIALNTILIPLFGVAGAATATAFTRVSRALVIMVFLKRRIGIFTGVFAPKLSQ